MTQVSVQNIPLCQDCAHYRASDMDVSLDECLCPALRVPDHVRAHSVRRWYCTEERVIGTHCAKAGTLFEPRKSF